MASGSPTVRPVTWNSNGESDAFGQSPDGRPPVVKTKSGSRAEAGSPSRYVAAFQNETSTDDCESELTECVQSTSRTGVSTSSVGSPAFGAACVGGGVITSMK